VAAGPALKKGCSGNRDSIRRGPAWKASNSASSMPAFGPGKDRKF